jgi:hypothetical protein
MPCIKLEFQVYMALVPGSPRTLQMGNSIVDHIILHGVETLIGFLWSPLQDTVHLCGIFYLPWSVLAVKKSQVSGK